MKAYLFLPLFIALAITSCENQPEKVKAANAMIVPPVVKAVEVVNSEPEPIVIEEPVGNSDIKQVREAPPADTAKKIIKSGEISFESGNVAQTRKQILASAKRYGGYIGNDREDTNGDEGQKQYILNVRIPSKYFDSFLDSASSTAVKIDSRRISITDVSTEFIDTRTRLQNKKILEARYLDLLKKGIKITDLLAIENKLAEIRSDIESTQGQLNYMSKQVAYSTLDITFYTRQATQVAAGNGFGYQLKQALADGFKSLESLFFWIISVWPMLLAATGVLVFARKRFKKPLAERTDN